MLLLSGSSIVARSSSQMLELRRCMGKTAVCSNTFTESRGSESWLKWSLVLSISRRPRSVSGG